MSFLNDLISIANNILWSYDLIVALIALGLYFTIKSNFVQFRLFTEMFRLLNESAKGFIKNESTENSKSVSSFQAFSISLASRVGTGNLAGVAIAIAIGGPGAIFWMWMIALIGAGSSFVESTLAQIYKVKDKDAWEYSFSLPFKKHLGQIDYS